jgi:hypothetical protein
VVRDVKSAGGCRNYVKISRGDVWGVPTTAELEADVARFTIEPLFVRGISDSI